jgi:hypothetical protein
MKKTTRAPSQEVAFTLEEFCAAHKISRAGYYLLRQRGKAPQEMRALHGRVIITAEAAAAWRRQHTVPARP